METEELGASAGGNFVIGETRLRFSLAKYVGTRVVLLGINSV